MSSSIRRFCVVVACGGLFAALTFLQTATQQSLVQAKEIKAVAAPALPDAPATRPPGPPSEFDGLTLPRNPDAQKLIAAAEDLIKESLQKPDSPQWVEAARALQSLLDAPEDAFVQMKRKGPDGKLVGHWVSIRAEANRLLGSMPPEGLEFYEIRYGPPANSLLSEAKAKGDLQLLGAVAQRYLHTKAGEKATSYLATYNLDRRRYLMAALCFERLVDRQGVDKLDERTLFKAALAFRRAGDQGRADRVWQQLASRIGRQGMKIGDQVVSASQLRRELDRGTEGGETVSKNDLPYFRGDPSRSVQGHGGPPFLEARWTFSTLPPEGEETEVVRKWIRDTVLQPALNHLEQRGQPVLPASFPIAAAGRLVFRGSEGIYAIDLKSGQLAWKSRCDGSLKEMGHTAEKRAYLTTGSPWFATYINFGPQSMFIDNSVIGTLSTDGARVYAVDDLAVPPPPQMFQNQGFPQQQANLGQFQSSFGHSKLQAVDLLNGKLIWELGDENYEKSKEFKDCFFLAPPLPLAGKLYTLLERNGELRLVCLDPVNGNLAWAQTLANTRDKLPFDVSRRIQAANLAYGDGILVCPTNAGAVLGLDLLTRSLVWAHAYRETDSAGAAAPPQGQVRFDPFGRPIKPVSMHADWKIAAPAIQDGKVVLSAPDGSSLHCLNLRTGELLWKEKRQNDDLYMAGIFNRKVVIVGKSYCRAVNLANRQPELKTLWQIPTGLPSGQGVASDNVYYLPLKATAESKEPAVYGIDLDKGLIRSRTISRKREVPGNLVFYEGDVLSQTVMGVTAYPQLKVKLDQITVRLQGNPKDPVGLTERGELRLDEGNLQGALEDLQTALVNNPPAEVRGKTRAKLYETFRGLFQSDFNAAEKQGLLEQYREMCKVEIPADADPAARKTLDEEQVRRQADFLCLLGKGREKQGRLNEAFQAYMDFGGVAGNQELVTVIDEPTTKSRPDVWARGRIVAMIDKATEDQRQPLRARVAERWKEVQSTNNIEELRRFVALFGPLFEAGKQARLKLAERLIEQGKEEDLRDAQLQLLQLRAQRDNPQMAAQAVEALARLMMRRNLMEHAAHYYRELGRDFAQVEIKDGKTGADFYNELTTDKRFLPYLDEPQPLWKGRLKAKEESGQFAQPPAFTFTADGEQLPFFVKHRLALDQNTAELKVLDRTSASGVPYWSSDKLWQNPNFNINQFLFSNPGNVRHAYHVQGHVVVFNLGHMVYGFDVVDRRKLWEFNLYSRSNAPLPPQSRLVPNRDSWQLIYPDNVSEKIGQVGPVQASYVCLLSRDGLVALDPLRGSVLWHKADISPRSEVFGDDQHVYVVDVGTDGAANATRAVRALDGVSVNVPRFAELYQRRLRILGRNLLVREEDAEGRVLVRLYDVHTGEDVWKKICPPKSLVLKTEEPDLTAVLEPTGAITVINLRARKEVANLMVNKDHLEKVDEGYLLQDSAQYYVVLNRPHDAQQLPFGAPTPNVMWGMRAVRANGMVYFFARETSKATYWSAVANQMLVLDQFQELPFVLFTARYNKPLGAVPNRGANQVVVIRSIDKRTGRLAFDRPELIGNNYQPFYSLNLNARDRTVELTSFNLKIRYFIDDGSDKSANAGSPGAAPGVGPPPVAPGGPVGVQVEAPQRIRQAPAPDRK